MWRFAPDGPRLERRLLALLPSRAWLGIYLDGSLGALSTALREAGRHLPQSVNPTAIITSSRLASERFVLASGHLGRTTVRTVTDVDPTSTGAQAYATLAPQIVGELPTLPGLEGFVAGQALAYGMIAGSSPGAIASRLREPGVFSRAATSPWSDRDPAAGTLMFRVVLPVFLTDNLIPLPSKANGGSPGEPVVGQFFSGGDWELASPGVFTPLPINSGPIESRTSAPSYLTHDRRRGGTRGGAKAK